MKQFQHQTLNTSQLSRYLISSNVHVTNDANSDLKGSTCTGSTIHYPITSANKLTETSTESTVPNFLESQNPSLKLRVSQSESSLIL